MKTIGFLLVSFTVWLLAACDDSPDTYRIEP